MPKKVAIPAASQSGESNPLACQAGRDWLAAELAEAVLVVHLGPGKQGWRFNESLRPAAIERTAFLRALNALLAKELTAKAA